MKKQNQEFTPFGPEWEKEVGKLTKAQIIALLKEAGLKQREALFFKPYPQGKLLPLHQEGFKMTAGGETVAEYCTAVPGGFPILKLFRPGNETLYYQISGNQLMEAIKALYENANRTEP